MEPKNSQIQHQPLQENSFASEAEKDQSLMMTHLDLKSQAQSFHASPANAVPPRKPSYGPPGGSERESLISEKFGSILDKVQQNRLFDKERFFTPKQKRILSVYLSKYLTVSQKFQIFDNSIFWFLSNFLLF